MINMHVSNPYAPMLIVTYVVMLRLVFSWIKVTYHILLAILEVLYPDYPEDRIRIRKES